MAERSGFYPSNRAAGIINNYPGYEVANVYKHIVSNGIFANAYGMLQVVAGAGMNVIIKPGAGLFLNQWYENDEENTFTIDTEATNNRIDLVVIEANKTPTTLKTYAKIVKGQPGSIPVAPVPIDTDTIKQYPLAAIKVNAGVPVISQVDITDLRGQAPTLWVTGVVDQLDTSSLYTQWAAAFNNWFNNVKDTLVSSTLMRKYSGVAYTNVVNQVEIAVPVSQYNINLDILQVYIEGRILNEAVDYNVYITDGVIYVGFERPLPVIGTEIHFDVFKSVDGSDAETYVERLYELEQRVGASMITADNGTDKLTLVTSFGSEVIKAGVGFHTLFIPATVTGMPVENKIWRGWCSFANASNGYVVVISNDGDVYTIVYNGEWTAWKGVYQHNKKMLYTSSAGNTLSSSSTVTPTKALSNCATGWVLHFGDYFHYHLPKVRYDGSKWSGQTLLIEIPYSMSDDGATRQTCMKKIIVTDTTIKGVEANVLSVNTNARLWGISEY